MEIDTQNTYNIIEDNVPSFNKKENVEKTASKKTTQETGKKQERKQVKNTEKIAIQQENTQAVSEDKKNVEEAKEFKNSNSSEINNQISIKTEGTKLQFKLVENVDPETGVKTKEMVVFLLNSETDEVIRRVPPEEVQGSSSGSFLDKIG